MNQIAMFEARPGLKPMWRYYGGKWRAAPLYPQPRHQTIVEPFAGAAGYSTRYADLDVVLVEKYPPVAEIWRYLIRTPAREILAIPLVEHVDDLPSGIAEGARYLVRFTLAVMQARPCNMLSNAFRKQSLKHPTWIRGWDAGQRERVASQVDRIRHWKLVEGDYTSAPRLRATYFVDPPYNNKAGMKYPCGPKQIDYLELGRWCRELPGQVVVCEQEGADWLPFQSFGQFVRGLNKSQGSREVVWLADDALS